MKSSILKFAATAGLVIATCSFAQDGSAVKKRDNGVGIRAAFDYGMMYGFEEEDDYVDGDPSGIGFEAGFAGRMEMIENLYFAPEINFSYLSTSHKYRDSDRTYKSMSLEIPLMIRGKIKDIVYVAAGPQLNLCLSGEVEANATFTDPVTHKEITSDFQDDFEQTTFTFGVAVGAGVQIIENLFFDARLYIGLSELYPDVESLDGKLNMSDLTGSWSQINMAGAKMMTIKAGFSYWFI